jgi:hypothetical protein
MTGTAHRRQGTHPDRGAYPAIDTSGPPEPPALAERPRLTPRGGYGDTTNAVVTPHQALGGRQPGALQRRPPGDDLTAASEPDGDVTGAESGVPDPGTGAADGECRTSPARRPGPRKRAGRVSSGCAADGTLWVSPADCDGALVRGGFLIGGLRRSGPMMAVRAVQDAAEQPEQVLAVGQLDAEACRLLAGVAPLGA